MAKPHHRLDGFGVGPVGPWRGGGSIAAESQEDAIATDKVGSWMYCEEYVPADDVMLRAQERADELGCVPLSPGAGAVLRVMAAAVQARTAVEIGTGTGVSALWLLAGMAPDGVLTTIDVEAEHQRAAKEAFAEAGIAPARVRAITGRALDVLPRLADGGYDLVLADADPLELPLYIEQAVRLLRTGGVLAVCHALHEDRVPDPARRDATTTAIREAGRMLRDDERLVPALVPAGDGLLLAVRR